MFKACGRGAGSTGRSPALCGLLRAALGARTNRSPPTWSMVTTCSWQALPPCNLQGESRGAPFLPGTSALLVPWSTEASMLLKHQSQVGFETFSHSPAALLTFCVGQTAVARSLCLVLLALGGTTGWTQSSFSSVGVTGPPGLGLSPTGTSGTMPRLVTPWWRQWPQWS